MSWYFDVLQKYFVFKGRSRRKEYWMFCLVNFIVAFLLGFIFGLLGKVLDMPILARVIGNVYSFAILIPAIAVGIRRLHDTDRKGWWLLLPIVNIVFLALPGNQGDNKYGPDPKVAAA